MLNLILNFFGIIKIRFLGDHIMEVADATVMSRLNVSKFCLYILYLCCGVQEGVWRQCHLDNEKHH
eukprot:14037258-Ditylum_brightwellii.AAC.1